MRGTCTRCIKTRSLVDGLCKVCRHSLKLMGLYDSSVQRPRIEFMHCGAIPPGAWPIGAFRCEVGPDRELTGEIYACEVHDGERLLLVQFDNTGFVMWTPLHGCEVEMYEVAA